jgi:hypothetical protein
MLRITTEAEPKKITLKLEEDRPIRQIGAAAQRQRQGDLANRQMAILPHSPI